MKKTKNGTITNVSSAEGLRGLPGGVAYGSSKFAVSGMTKNVAVDLGKYGIRVNSLHPGTTKTPLLMDRNPDIESLGIPPNRAGEQEVLSEFVLFLASDNSSYATGSEFVADGGITAHM